MNEILLKPKIVLDNQNIQYLVTSIFIDDVELADFEIYCTDLECLHDSFTHNGEHNILTCWCGVPDCVGLRRGISVTHLDNAVVWNMLEPNEHKYIFSKPDYLNLFKLLKSELFNLKYSISSFDSLEIVPYLGEEVISKIMYDKHYIKINHA